MVAQDFWSDMISAEEEDDFDCVDISVQQVDVYRQGNRPQLKQPSRMLRMWRSVNSKISEFYRYFHVIFGTAAYQPVQPSEHSLKTAKLLFRLLRARRPLTQPPDLENVMLQMCDEEDEDEEETQDYVDADEPRLWAEVREVLQECAELDSLLHVCNRQGFNVLLMAILQQDRQVLQVLIDEGVSLNRSNCTMPLHLACKIGDLQTVQLLIGHGALQDLEAGMCFPRPHTPIVHVPSRFHFLETDIFSCDSDHALPLMYAIEGDHLDVVRCLLMDTDNGRDRWPYHRHPLHHACHHGSYRCIDYLASHQPAELATTDEEGLTPLLHAAPWGQLCVKYLVEGGANVHSTNFKSQTALHVLFNQIQKPLELFGTTKFLLGTGMEQDVNRVDHQGNTPLHSLITQLNRKVSSYPQGADELSQGEFDQQIIQTMEILLQYNCDANRVNNSGVTALHKVILMLDFLTSSDPSGITLQTLPSREKYQVNFDLVHQGLEVLLRHGADPNKTTSAGRTALIILLQMALNTDPVKLHRFGRGFLKCLSLLCEYGANPSRTLMCHINVITLLCKIGHKCLLVLNDTAKQSMSEFYKEMLAVLLLHGLDSNHCSNRKRPAVAGASGNILLEMCKLGQCLKKPADFSYIYDWVLTLLQWGANPDIEPYPSDSIICHSQSSIFLKPKGSQAVNQIMYEIKDLKEIFDGGYVAKLIMLFYNSMGHEALYGCLNTAKFLSRFDPNRAPHGRFLELIHILSSQPRSLKQIARVSIYKSLNRELNLKVDKLPLPRAVKVYLLEVQ